MSTDKLTRKWGGPSELADLLEAMPGGMGIAVRDFALLTLAGQLATSFRGQLLFKGGFVLRHVHGLLRFSKDVDATRHEPARNKFNSEAVAEAIRQASIHNIVRFVPEEPATDTARSLDFDNVRVIGVTFPSSTVQVEVSYREAVVDEPVSALIGAPFYEDFEILVMTVEEMAAEKLRTLAQRLRPTDLADLAALLSMPSTSDAAIRRLALVKFDLVAQGKTNRLDRLERQIADLADSYDAVVPGLFPEAPTYSEAMATVWPRVKSLIP